MYPRGEKQKNHLHFSETLTTAKKTETKKEMKLLRSLFKPSVNGRREKNIE